MKNLRRTGQGREASEKLSRLKLQTRQQRLNNASAERTLRRSDRPATEKRTSLGSRAMRSARSGANEVVSSTRPEQENIDLENKIESGAAFKTRMVASKAADKVPGAGTVVKTVSSRSGVAENAEAVGQRYAKDSGRRAGLRTARVAGRLSKRSAFAAGRGVRTAAGTAASSARSGGAAASRAAQVAARAAAQAAQSAVTLARATVAVVSGVVTSTPFLAGLVAVVAVIAVVMAFLTALFPTVSQAACSTTTGTAVAGGTVEGFDAEQMQNAAAIISAANDLGLPQAAQVLGVQAAIGESGLRVLNRGDAAGPDSRGLFQQRDNGAWGSYADRMDPKISATNFFKALQRVPGWEAMEPSLAINRVQGNFDPNYYTDFRAQAIQVVEASTGTTVSNGGVCATGSVVGNPKGDWVYPLDSPAAVMTSGYGPRATPAATANINNGFHYGVDISAGGVPQVVAPTDMKITRATPAAQDTWGAGENIAGTSLDGQYSFGLFHMVAGSLKVKSGDVVAAGTPLGLMGATGNVSGPHLHLEIYSPARDNPIPAQGAVDPVPILTKAGAWK